MTFKEAISYLDSTQKFGWKPGLETIRLLMRELGDPQNRLQYVHVAGTNGKGSTAAFISSILSCAGYKTGLYISPHIQRFNERMSCCGEEITDDQVAILTEEVKLAAEMIVQRGAQNRVPPRVHDLLRVDGHGAFLRTLPNARRNAVDGLLV